MGRERQQRQHCFLRVVSLSFGIGWNGPPGNRHRDAMNFKRLFTTTLFNPKTVKEASIVPRFILSFIMRDKTLSPSRSRDGQGFPPKRRAVGQKHRENQKNSYFYLYTKFFGCTWRLGVLAANIIFALPLQASFLDFSVPARDAAMGGNGVALPEGTSSLVFNPAGLGDEYRFEVSARYEDLFAGIGGDDLSTGNLSAVFPLDRGDGLGFSVDNFGANTIQQDQLQVAFGKSFGANSFLHALRLGVDLSYLRQQFTLLAPLAGVNPGNVSAGAFSVGAGALYDPFSWGTLGISVENLNQPNLGVVGVDTVPLLARYGVALRPPVGADRLILTLAQTLSAGTLDTQGGAEWKFGLWGLSLRAGGDANSGAAGFGWQTNGLTIDYAYQFSWNQAPSINGVGLPGSHLLEVGFTWENSSREGRVFDELVFKGGKALKDRQWKEAFWYYQQAYLLKPSESSVIQGRDAALRQYNFQRAEIYYQEGAKAEKRGYFLEAQRDYEWAVSLAPQEGRYSASQNRVKKSLTQGALGDPRVRDMLEKSVGLLKRGENGAALKEIKKGLALYPGDAFLQFVARAFARKSGSAVESEDKKMEQLAAEAEIFRSKGRLDLARETWHEMLKTDPTNAMARENLAQNDSAKPAHTLSEAQKMHVQALLQKGLKAFANGDTEAAVKDWEEVLQIDSLNVNALNNLTRVKMEEGGDKK
jgi:tetratricopeptide (TPR) repeat protein